jgi:transposase-like protein
VAMDSRGSKQRRVRWSGEEIRELIGRYENSGQTQIEFCREWGLALSSFQTYLRKHRRAGAAEKRAGVEPSCPRLVEVEVQATKQAPDELSKRAKAGEQTVHGLKWSSGVGLELLLALGESGVV